MRDTRQAVFIDDFENRNRNQNPLLLLGTDRRHKSLVSVGALDGATPRMPLSLLRKEGPMFKVLTMFAVAMTFHLKAQAQESEFQSWNDACAIAEHSVAEGDLVFLDIPVGLFRQVAATSHSWTSHVGIVFRGQDGKWIVADSSVPVSRERPLCDFLKKSAKYKFEIRRPIHPPTAAEINIMKMSAKSMLNRFYDLGFNFDSKRLFCSKFVYLVYKSIGTEVGRLQTFKDLLDEKPPASAIRFWKFWFFGRIPFERRTITPASQLNDLKFTTILKGNP